MSTSRDRGHPADVPWAQRALPWDQAPARAAADEPLRLLVVEDDPIQQKAYRAVARQYGFSVTVVSRGADVLRTALTQRPDAVLLDLKVEDGLTLGVLATLRGSPETRHLPVAIVSAYLLPEVQRQLARFGGVECLAKPWTLEELLATIGRLTGEGPLAG